MGSYNRSHYAGLRRVSLAVESSPLPNSYEGMYQRAEALVRSGRPDAALEILERIQKRLGSLSENTLLQNPGLADFGYRSGTSLVELHMAEGRYDDAIAALERLHRFAPQFASVLNRQAALTLAAKGDLEQAQAQLTSLATDSPDESFLWLGLAEVLIARELYDEAEDTLDRAMEGADDGTLKAIIEHRRFAAHAARRRVAEAVADWERMSEFDAAIASYRAHELYDLLLEADERDTLRSLLRKDSSKIRTEFYRGLLDHAAGDFSAGTAKWEGLIKISPFEDRLGVFEWAQAALRLGKMEEAMTILVASSQDGASPRSLLLLAIGAARSGRVEQVLKVLERGTRLLRTYVPRSERYSRKEWELFTSLVDNRDLWQAVAPYFDTGREAA